MMMNQFTGKYPVSKTLKFELRPIGKTFDNLVSRGLLDEDEHRADSRTIVKNILDDYHKKYINDRLRTLVIPVEHNGKMNSLQEYMLVYNELEKGQKTSPVLDKIKKNIYRLIAGHLQDSPAFARMFKKEIIKEDLLDFATDEEEKACIREFAGYTSYFLGYHETRKPIYGGDGKNNSVAHRLIEENLPVFLENMKIWDTFLKDRLNPEDIENLYRQMEPYLNFSGIDEVFSLMNFNNVLTQQDIDVYNSVLGGMTLDDGTQVKGLNVLINLYNQQLGQRKDVTRLPALKKLKKQILSDKVTLSWIPDKFNSDKEVLDALYQYCNVLFEGPLKDLTYNGQNLLNLITNIDAFDDKHLYIRNDKGLAEISWSLCGTPLALRGLIIEDEKKRVPKKKKETDWDWEERIGKTLDKQKYYSIAYLNDVANRMVDKKERSVQKDYFSDATVFLSVHEKFRQAEGLLTTPYPENRKLSQDETAVRYIRELLESIKQLQNYIKPLTAGMDVTDADAQFYGVFAPMWETVREVNGLYDKVSAYLKKKPYSTDKVKLNFRNVSLLSGWSTTKRRVAGSVILRKGDKYYLGVADSEHRGAFEEKNLKEGVSNYEIMDYRVLPGASKMMPVLFLSDSGICTNHPSDEVLAVYRNNTYLRSSENFSKKDVWLLVDYFKNCLANHPDYGTWGLTFTDTEKYEDISGFYSELDKQTYRVNFSLADEKEIDRMVEDGEIYLFQIWNRDFSSFSKGNPQLHTLYFKALFEPMNLNEKSVYKLNGGAEVFYRKASLKKKRPTHPAGIPIANKNPLTTKRHSVFDYDLIMAKRFTVDKFFIHIPVTMNWQSGGLNNINGLVNDYIRENDIHIIGIARGEDNLLYACIIDLKGNVKECISLNVIESGKDGHVCRTDYAKLIRERMQQRNDEQKLWKEITNIKELMDGYLSQVIHKITGWMEKYNAVVVLENIDFLARVGKPIIDRATLSKFERQLVEKLNYLVRKDNRPDMAGGLFNAVQITNKFESFEKIGNQTGAVFFVSGIATALTDPITGYYDAVNFRFDKIEQARKMVEMLDGFTYDTRNRRFRIDIDFAKFTKSLAPSRTRWTLHTWGQRYRNRKTPAAKWVTETIDLTGSMSDLLVRFGIDLYGDIRQQILDKTATKIPGVKDFLLELMILLDLTAKLRNVNMQTGERVCYSPVNDEKGHFFTTDFGYDEINSCPDAVIAYNIARKGLMYIRSIRETEKGKKMTLSCSYQDWLKNMQESDF